MKPMLVKKGGFKKPPALRRIENETLNLSLPTEVSEPSDVLWDYGIMIHAEKKIGKTSITSMIPDVLFLMTQPGAKSFRVHQRFVKTWEEFKAYVILLEKDTKGENRFKRVALDHIDGVYEACKKFVCAQEGWDHPDDGGGYGKGWGKVNDEFEPWMGRLLACGKGVILLTHSKIKDVKTRTGREYTKIMTTLSGGAWTILEQNIDIWIHLFYDGDKRMMQIVGDDHVGAGHNLEEHFRYTDGTPIKFIPMGANKKEAYDNLIAAFNNELERPEEEETEAEEPKEEEEPKPKSKFIVKKK